MSALAVVSSPTDHEGDDLQLVAGVRAGDDRAFEVLYRRYQGRITAYVRSMVHDHGRAEDITQEVFMSALRRMRETEVAIAFKPWIYEIAKNACIDAWRRSRNRDEVSFDAQDALGADDHGRLAGPGVTPDSAIEGKVAFDNLCGAFGGLSQTHHEILVMREFEGLSYREIGERLGMSRPGVESTLFRARRRLSEEYEELVSGERCLRVQRIIDGRTAGVRDQRRMARHISHCQPCRRYARLSGLDLDVAARPLPAAASKIAALIPLPPFLRRRGGGDEAGALLAPSHTAPLANWSATVASTVDPATVSGWSKALATAATVAVASLGAGAAIHEHRAIEGLFGGGPSARAAKSTSSQPREATRPVRAPSAAARTTRPVTATEPAPAAGIADPAAPVASAPGAGKPVLPSARLATPQAPAKVTGGGDEPAAATPSVPVPVGAAPTLPATPSPDEEALSKTVERLNDVAIEPTAPAADTPAGPASTVTGRVETTTGAVSDTLSTTGAGDGDAGAPATRSATPTDVLATVSEKVTGTLRTEIPGPTTP